MSKVIAAGTVSDEAIMFLIGKGAHIDSTFGISMIELPEDAEICNPGYQSPQSEYAVQWTDEDGNDPSEWIKVYINFDASKSEVQLERTSDPVKEMRMIESETWKSYLRGDLDPRNREF